MTSHPDQPEKLEQMQQLVFDQRRKVNKAFPIGGGLWTRPEILNLSQQNPASEFFYTSDVIEIPEATARQAWAPQQYRND